ncbi:MAG: exodeoxyribonuclease I [Mesosutterella sp.]|nr:exodeoxyribonuclease I [Mesosutterella sp.]
MPDSFYWFDYETFGLRRGEALPAQFAGRRTDLELNPVDGGEVFYCRPGLDMLPSPQSCALTGILPQYCERHGLPEGLFAREVLRRLGAQGTVGIGYNSLAFDDEVTRFLLWRNLLPPYEREFNNDCGRWDLYPLVLAYWALRPEGVNWPRWSECIGWLNEKRLLKLPEPKNPDAFCFKLECLSRANGLGHEKAHDALSDVNATIELARFIRSRNPRFWSWAFENQTKRKVIAQINHPAVLWLDPHQRQDRGYLRFVRQIGADSVNPNLVYLWDLSRDPAELLDQTPESIRQRTFRKTADLPEGVSPLPIYRLAVNHHPFVCSAVHVLGPRRAEEFGWDFSQIQKNASWFTAERLRLASDLFSRAFPARGGAEAEPEDADVALYSSGFPSDRDKGMLKSLQNLSPGELEQRVHSGRVIFEKPVYYELLLRYRARNNPEYLNAEEQSRWKAFVRQKMKSNLPRFESEVRALEESLEGRGEDIVAQLRQWPRRDALRQILSEEGVKGGQRENERQEL